jgi:multisubunit Na+/H+ antiporter MnhF subunit
VVDVALTLALLSAFASVAFVKFAVKQDRKAGGEGQLP